MRTQHATDTIAASRFVSITRLYRSHDQSCPADHNGATLIVAELNPALMTIRANGSPTLTARASPAGRMQRNS